jgi:hypothetical protein
MYYACIARTSLYYCELYIRDTRPAREMRANAFMNQYTPPNFQGPMRFAYRHGIGGMYRYFFARFMLRIGMHA